MENAVVISGCSGGGKSTLIAELSRRGFAVVSEPGRRIVAEELAGDGKSLPWVSLENLRAEQSIWAAVTAKRPTH